MNNEEEYLEEINERADKCHEPETHDEFAWSDVNNCKLDDDASVQRRYPFKSART